MTLEQLKARAQQLEAAITNQTQTVFRLQGHKDEIDFQISEMIKEAGETKVDEPSVDLVETEVE